MKLTDSDLKKYIVNRDIEIQKRIDAKTKEILQIVCNIFFSSDLSKYDVIYTARYGDESSYPYITKVHPKEILCYYLRDKTGKYISAYTNEADYTRYFRQEFLLMDLEKVKAIIQAEKDKTSRF